MKSLARKWVWRLNLCSTMCVRVNNRVQQLCHARSHPLFMHPHIKPAVKVDCLHFCMHQRAMVRVLTLEFSNGYINGSFKLAVAQLKALVTSLVYHEEFWFLLGLKLHKKDHLQSHSLGTTIEFRCPHLNSPVRVPVVTFPNLWCSPLRSH